MARTSFTVTELNAHIKQLLDADALLGNVCVTGELSNYKVYPSGHHYFTLKDAESSLRCVMFRSSAQSLRFRPASGMSVAAIGRIAVYPRDGAYQLYCTRLIPGGVGDLYAAYEQLKEQLQKEGLFDRMHKKPLPAFPQRIAVITSSAGAAVRDIIRVLGKRWPASEVVLLPVRVQGAEAPAEIAGAIRYANRYHVGDLIITGRGGGSIEDLWAFNDERVARAIYDSDIPVISAVGHEPDVTISDFVADLRAATPSNAAELAVPNAEDLRETLRSYDIRITQAMRKQMTQRRAALRHLLAHRLRYADVIAAQRLAQILRIRHGKLRRIGRCRRAQVSHKVRDGHIRLVTDGGDNRNVRVIDRARNALVVKRPQVLDRAAAAPGDDEIAHMIAVGITNRPGDLRRSFRTLNAHRQQHDLAGRPALAEHADNVAHGCARRRRDHSDPLRKCRQRLFVHTVKQALFL